MSRRGVVDRVAAVALLVGVLGAAGWVVAPRGCADGPRVGRASHTDPQTLRAAYEAIEVTGLALEGHRRDTGRYPDGLDSLVPNYLRRLPNDPFRAPHGPLGYVSPPGNPDGRILYSVGPDGLDQGGSPLDPITRQGDLAYPVR